MGDRKFAKESLIVAASLACMCVIIVFTSLANARFDITQMFSDENISNAVISAAITIFGTIVSVPAGSAGTKQRYNADGTPGRYLQEFELYATVRDAIEPRRSAFNQWHTQQHLKELHQKRVEYLLSRGIIQAEDILKLSREQVSHLTTCQKYIVDGKEMYFKSLTRLQIFACQRVLAGWVTVHKLPDFYFLYVDGKSSKSFYDQAYYEHRNTTVLMASKLAYKIFIGFVIASVFTGLAIAPKEDLSNVDFIMHALIIIAARIFTAITSTLWGWLLGQELAYRECYYINGRTQFLKLFESDTTFVEESSQELARKDYLLEKGVEPDENISNASENLILG